MIFLLYISENILINVETTYKILPENVML